MIRRLLIVLLCMALPWQAGAAAAWHASHCLRAGAAPQAGQAVTADAALSQGVASEAAAAMPDPACCDGQKGHGKGDVGCPGTSICHGLVFALAAAWPLLTAAAPERTAELPLAIGAPPQPLAVVWRPPISS